MVLMRRIVDQALLLVPTAEGSAVELARDGELTLACGAGSLSDRVGTRSPLGASLSGLAIRRSQTLYCHDSASDDRVGEGAREMAGAASMICVPLRRGGEAIGVLKITGSQPRAFGTSELGTLTRLADFISAAIGTALDIAQITGELLASAGDREGRLPHRQTRPRAGVIDAESVTEFLANVLQPGIVADTELRRRVSAVLERSAIGIVCQPIVDLCSMELVGVEALARFRARPGQPPDMWFEQAHRVGCGVQLELSALNKALALLQRIPAHAYLAINVGPEAIRAPELPELLDSVDAMRVVLELTEHVRVDDYPGLREAVFEIRSTGARLAIDDTGAGFASLVHILNLAPDIIKLDRNLTHGIDLDPVRRALAGALVSFAADVAAPVLAEGIQTYGELETVRELGIRYGQGYLLGRPGPLTPMLDGINHSSPKCRSL